MFGWLRRYRHGRGFGIHSPFAYRFVTEVLKEDFPYYDYALFPDRLQRLLYRIAVYFQPSTVKAFGDADLSPVLCACPKASSTDGDDWQVAVVDLNRRPEASGTVGSAKSPEARGSVGSSKSSEAGSSKSPSAQEAKGCPQVRSLLCRKPSACGDLVVVLLGPHREELADLKAWLSAEGCGMTFDNERDMAIAVLRRKLPRQDFTAKF